VLIDIVLVLAGTLIACGLVLFSVFELLWPRRDVDRRRARPRPAARPVSPRSVTEPSTLEPAARAKDVAGESPGGETASKTRVREVRVPSVRPRGAPAPSAASGPPRPADTLATGPPDPVPAPQLELPSDAEGGDVGSTPEPVRPPPLEQCQTFFASGRFVDVVTEATAALAAGDEVAPSPREQAALWNLIGRAGERLGDHEAARTALERAIDVAPEAERDGFRVQLASLALSVASDILTRCRGLSDERRIALLPEARTWLERAQNERPDDEGIAAAREAVNTGYWSATESVIRGLVRRQEFTAARGRLVEASADAGLPAVTREAFGALYAEVLGSEIGQLTAAAIRDTGEGREWEVVSTLEQAEKLLGESGDVLPPERYQEIARRLRLAYTKTGIRRLEAGEHEDAVTALLRALAYAGEDEARRQEPGAVLADALRRLAEDRARVIREVAEMGNRESARVQVAKLCGLVESALRAGVPADAVEGVQATLAALGAELG
jgi:tetratricopeptide (TPR) repeat protein